MFDETFTILVLIFENDAFDFGFSLKLKNKNL